MAIGFLGALGAGALGGAAVTIVIRAVDRFSKTFNIANIGLVKLGLGLTAVGIAGTFMIKGLVKVAGQFEQTQIAFTTMLGSAEEAQKLLKELEDFAARKPFQIPDVEKNDKLLLAMGIEVEKILPTMKALGDVAAGLSVPLERIALNFGQVKTQSKLTGRELRDFNIAGVPLIQEIAKNMGLTEVAVKDLVSASKIGFDEVEKAFITMSSEGGKFFDLMDAQSKTFLGQISNIEDSMTSVARVMGKVFLPAAKAVAERLAVIIGWFQEHPTVSKFAAAALGIAVALLLIIGPLLLISLALPFLITGFATLVAVTLPWTLAIIGVIVVLGTLAAIFFKIRDNMDAFKVGVALIWNDIVGFFEKGINKIIGAMNVLIRGFRKTAEFFGFEGPSDIGNITLGRIDIDAMVEAINAQKEITEEIKEQNKALTIQDKLLEIQSGATKFKKFLFDPITGDVFQRGVSLTSTDFQTSAAFRRATRGQGIIINIENITGLDPEEISRELAKELGDKTTL